MVLRGLCEGTVAGKNGKRKKSVLQTWYVLEGDRNGEPSWEEQAQNIDKRLSDNNDRMGHWGSKNMPSARPGAVYTFECPKPGTIRPGTARFVALLDDNDFVNRWQAEYEGFKAAANAKKMEQSETLRDLNWEALKPFREAYHSATSFQQAAILVKVMDYVRRYR
jgi:hypothetical protein